MAILIPNYIDIYKNKSPGEETIFNMLKEDPATKDWLVFHSLSLYKHVNQEMGEIDFLIVIPDKGILVVEVKAHHHIKYQDGKWYLGKQDQNGELRGPFKQAKDAMFSLKNYLREKHSYYENLEFYSLVIFTHCNFEQNTIEWGRHEYINCLELEKSSISNLLLNFIKISDKNKIEAKANKYEKNKSTITLKKINAEYCKKIKDLLRPNFETPLSNELIINNIKKELIKFTSEQIDAIDAIINNPRLLFNGSAGTGKTFIAIEVALRKAIEGKKVLFITFNRLINEYIAKKLSSYTNINVITIDKLFREQFKTIRDDLSREERENLIADLVVNDKYDFLIVDEAQDLLNDELNLLFLEQYLDGAFKGGNWNIYGDFKLQSIYSLRNEADAFKEILDEFAGKNNYFTYELTKNCRNPENTVRKVLDLLSIGAPYKSYLRVNPSIGNTELHCYKDDSDFLKIINEVITSVKRKGFKNKDIIILTFTKFKGSGLERVRNNEKLKVQKFDWGINDIRYSTLYKFKGLEAPIIIITDVDKLASEYAIKKLFTGASRATDSVYFLVNETAQNEFLDLMLQLGNEG